MFEFIAMASAIFLTLYLIGFLCIVVYVMIYAGYQDEFEANKYMEIKGLDKIMNGLAWPVTLAFKGLSKLGKYIRNRK